MELYTMIAYHSRGLDRDRDSSQPCEYCLHKYQNPDDYDIVKDDVPLQRRMIRQACDIDHVYGRGGGENRNYENRMYDPKNLIMLCRKCHSQKGGEKMKKIFCKIILSKLIHKTYEECIATNKAIERKRMSTVKTLQN